MATPEFAALRVANERYLRCMAADGNGALAAVADGRPLAGRPIASLWERREAEAKALPPLEAAKAQHVASRAAE